MMMRMVGAGGLRLLTDGVCAADHDNPVGYFEFERVKQFEKGDTGWLPDARGRAVKIISALLVHLPRGHRIYIRVLFMRRDVEEVLASQRRMVANCGTTTNIVSE